MLSGTNVYKENPSTGDKYVALGDRLSALNDEISCWEKPNNSAVGITASAQVLSGPGVVYGFTIVSHTAGATIRFSDALTATTPYVSSAFTTVAGHLAGTFIPIGSPSFGMQMVTGAYVTITGTCEIIPAVRLNATT